MPKKLPNKKQTYAFIDATNIIYSASRLGWKVDFKKLAKYLKERYGVKRILYYAGVDTKNLKQMRFYEKLQEFGFELRLIPVKTFSDGKKKADVDSRMTFEMMLYLEKYDNLVVFTGDGDYYWVLEYLKNIKNIKLFGCGRSIAKELKQLLGGNVTDMDSIKKLVSFSQKNEADAFKESASRYYAKSVTKKEKHVKK
jgi:uncharacterized LabA/DUF88 family protein